MSHESVTSLTERSRRSRMETSLLVTKLIMLTQAAVEMGLQPI